MPPGSTPIIQHVVTQAMPAGMRRCFAALGAPLDTVDVRFVNGQFYSRLRPLISPDSPATRLPPRAVLKVATRIHPEMRRRNRTASKVMAARPWIAVIDDWHHGGKAAIETENLRVQAVDLGGLDDDALLAEVHRRLDHCVRNWEHHFWLHGFDLGPIGQFLFEAGQLGLDPLELLSLLEGASPSTTAPTVALVQIREAAEAAGAEPSTLDELRAVSPAISGAIDDYLARRGTVLFSRYDIDGVTLGERPDLVLASILSAEVHDPTAEVIARTAVVRKRVPAEHLARFDDLLGNARAAMDLRDDNGPTTAEWPLGLVRMALLELGRRLVASGALDDGALVLELDPTEIAPELFAGRPDADELRFRADRRRAWKAADAPLLLGPDELKPPVDVLPDGLARLVGMVDTVMQHMGMDGAKRRSGLHGAGIGERSVRGIARVAASAEEALDVLEPGDVLVVAGTTPAYNLVLSLAGAVVTAEGGAMSHAAVIARELGIPAVIGASGALTDIPNGSLVEVDAVAGEVRLISTA